LFGCNGVETKIQSSHQPKNPRNYPRILEINEPKGIEIKRMSGRNEKGEEERVLTSPTSGEKHAVDGVVAVATTVTAELTPLWLDVVRRGRGNGRRKHAASVSSGCAVTPSLPATVPSPPCPPFFARERSVGGKHTRWKAWI
jgi:hypothetical protein